jgi:hypothetical protein
MMDTISRKRERPSIIYCRTEYIIKTKITGGEGGNRIDKGERGREEEEETLQFNRERRE